MEFIMTLRRRHPQFAQQGREGGFMQQDAEECWSSLLTSLRDNLRDPGGWVGVGGLGVGEGVGVQARGELARAHHMLHPTPAEAGSDSAIRRLFGLGLHTSLKCEESGETIEVRAGGDERQCDRVARCSSLILSPPHRLGHPPPPRRRTRWSMRCAATSTWR